MHVSRDEVEAAVLRHREATDRLLEPGLGDPIRLTWIDPGPGAPVLAENFLAHLDCDGAAINAVLRDAYPYLDRVPGLKREVHARIRLVAWMTLRGFHQLAPAIRAAQAEPEAMRRLGLARGAPGYETMRLFLHRRLAGTQVARLKEALLQEEKRLLPSLGGHQVEDATPIEARRRDDEAPYNGHYKTNMQKLEARWDPTHEALLADQFYKGTAHEGRWLDPLTGRLELLGIHAQRLVVDGGYTSFVTIAAQWRRGTHYLFRSQEGWVVDEASARAEALKRIQLHWRDDGFPLEGSWEQKLRFLFDHGTDADRDAVGRWVRDHALTHRTPDETSRIGADRSQNEGLNAEFKRLPFTPARAGAREMLRRVHACTLTLHLVQLARLQNGVKDHLCRTAYLV